MSSQMWPSYWALAVLIVIPFLYGCFAHAAEACFEAKGGWLSQFSYESIRSASRYRLGVMGGLAGLTLGAMLGIKFGIQADRGALVLLGYMTLLGSLGCIAGSMTFWLGGHEAFPFVGLGPIAGAIGSAINGTNLVVGSAAGLVFGLH